MRRKNKQRRIPRQKQQKKIFRTPPNPPPRNPFATPREICDIYRRGANLSTSLPNNQLEMETEMGVLRFNWGRSNRIIHSNRNADNPTSPEEILLGAYQSFVKPDDWHVALIYIRNHNIPTAIRQYMKIRRPIFKNLEKLVLRYRTY